MLYYTITKIRIISDNYKSLYDDFYFKRPVRFLKPDRSESTDKILTNKIKIVWSIYYSIRYIRIICFKCRGYFGWFLSPFKFKCINLIRRTLNQINFTTTVISPKIEFFVHSMEMILLDALANQITFPQRSCFAETFNFIYHQF